MERAHATAKWDYSHKVALVVGGTAGIGEAIARRLWKSGAKLAIAARGEEGLRSLKSSLDGVPECIQTDIVDPQQVANMVRKTVEAFARGLECDHL